MADGVDEMEFTHSEYAMIRLAIQARISLLKSLNPDNAPNAARAAEEYKALLIKIEENQP